MEHENLTHGLDRLADEAEPRPVDVRHIIGRARARKQSRRAVIAVSGATAVVLVGAIAITALATESNKQPVVAAKHPTSSPQTSGLTPVTPAEGDVLEGGTPPPRQIDADAQSAKFDGQFAAAQGELIPGQFTVGKPSLDSSPDGKTFVFSGTPAGNGHSAYYKASATLTDAEGSATIDIWVFKNPAGTQLSHQNGQIFGPCRQEEPNCVLQTLQDGTVAAAQPNSRPPALTLSSTLTAQRPDGTYIQVLTNVGSPSLTKPRAVAPLNADELFKFATAFTW